MENNKKVALCLHGLFDSTTDSSSLGIVGYEYIKKHILDVYDTDVYIHSWDLVKSEIIKNLYNPIKCKFEKQIDFSELIHNKKLDNLIGAPRSPQSVLSHFYSIQKSFELLYLNNTKKYDIVIKTRPDFLHVHTDIEKYFDRIHDTLFHINTGITYCPNRVYEMFLLSSSSIMKTVCESWLNFNQLVSTDYSLHMTRLDACRLVYSQCVINNIKIDTFEKVLGDVLRIENYLDYQSFENMFI